MKKYTWLPMILILICIFTNTVFSQIDATLAFPDTNISSSSTITIPIFVSTSETIGLAQFIIEFNSTIIEYKEAVIGNGASGFTISMLNTTLPFSPSAANTDKNVLIQISGGGAGSFTGEHKEVIKLKFDVKTAGVSPLAFDQVVNHTFLTTTGLSDIAGSKIAFDDGSVTVTTTSVISSPR